MERFEQRSWPEGRREGMPVVNLAFNLCAQLSKCKIPLSVRDDSLKNSQSF